MPAAVLKNRSVIAITGPEAAPFLQGLVTCDLSKTAEGEARFGALLSPQGKILADFFIHKHDNGFELDVAREISAELMKKLNLYRLRAKVVILDASAERGIIALWGGPASPPLALALWDDPRGHGLGQRAIAPQSVLADFAQSGSEDDYQRHCMNCGVPIGGIDFAFGSLFPHEANMDLLHGLSFEKGCYIGQEIVARVEHRGTARKRFVRVHFAGDALPESTPLMDGDITIGTLARNEQGRGLALLRLDHAREAQAQGRALMAATAESKIAVTWQEPA